ncbi:MAG: hypothetical protein QOH29_196 [Actinomycetota bacterium]|nr:hypothetical protein [Actinomycetota bacterium]
MTKRAPRTWLAPVGGISGVVLAVIAVAIATQPHLHVTMPTAVEIAGGQTRAAAGDEAGSPRLTLVYPRRSVDVLDEPDADDAPAGSTSASPQANATTPSPRPTPLARPLPRASGDDSAAQPTGQSADPSSTPSRTGTGSGSGEPPDDYGWTPSTSKSPSPSRSPSPTWHPSRTPTPSPTRSSTRTPTPSTSPSPSTTRSDD